MSHHMMPHMFSHMALHMKRSVGRNDDDGSFRDTKILERNVVMMWGCFRCFVLS